jgi:hypothetical protein
VAEVTVTNTGDGLLVITDVITSCGCATADYPKEPIRPGEEKNIRVKYKADQPEHINKTVTVYANAEGSPFQVKITGDAQ